jgi:hypothetical protein
MVKTLQLQRAVTPEHVARYRGGVLAAFRLERRIALETMARQVGWRRRVFKTWALGKPRVKWHRDSVSGWYVVRITQDVETVAEARGT